MSVDGFDASESLLDQQLRKWLETSGRALELRVARTLAEHGAAVRPSLAYTDSVTGQQRETDVVAAFEWDHQLHETAPLRCSLTAVIECKSGRKEPWVAFGGVAQQASVAKTEDWLAFSHAPYTNVLEEVTVRLPGSPPFTSTLPATHIVSAKLGSSSKGSVEQNVAGNAVRQVLAAADGLRAEYLERQGRESRGLFIVPILVTATPLYYCELDSSREVLLAEREAVDVWAYAADGRRVRVYVMTEARLPAFASDLRDRAVTVT